MWIFIVVVRILPVLLPLVVSSSADLFCLQNYPNPSCLHLMEPDAEVYLRICLSTVFIILEGCETKITDLKRILHVKW